LKLVALFCHPERERRIFYAMQVADWSLLEDASSVQHDKRYEKINMSSWARAKDLLRPASSTFCLPVVKILCFWDNKKGVVSGWIPQCWFMKFGKTRKTLFSLLPLIIGKQPKDHVEQKKRFFNTYNIK